VEWPSELPLYYSWCHQCHQNAFLSIFPLSSGIEKKSLWGRGGRAKSGELAGCSNTVICVVAKKFAALIQTPTFSRRHTKTHADSNRCHSERDCHRSTTTQLWNADMSKSSNQSKVFFCPVLPRQAHGGEFMNLILRPRTYTVWFVPPPVVKVAIIRQHKHIHLPYKSLLDTTCYWRCNVQFPTILNTNYSYCIWNNALAYVTKETANGSVRNSKEWA